MPESPQDKNDLRPWEQRTNEPNSRGGLLDWYGGLSHRGRLRWISLLFIALNAIGLPFGILWPKLLAIAVAALVVSFLIPESLE